MFLVLVYFSDVLGFVLPIRMESELEAERDFTEMMGFTGFGTSKNRSHKKSEKSGAKIVKHRKLKRFGKPKPKAGPHNGGTRSMHKS